MDTEVRFVWQATKKVTERDLFTVLGYYRACCDKAEEYIHKVAPEEYYIKIALPCRDIEYISEPIAVMMPSPIRIFPFGECDADLWRIIVNDKGNPLTTLIHDVCSCTKYIRSIMGYDKFWLDRTDLTKYHIVDPLSILSMEKLYEDADKYIENA